MVASSEIVVDRKWTKIDMHRIGAEYGCSGWPQVFRGPVMKYLNLFRTQNKPWERLYYALKITGKKQWSSRWEDHCFFPVIFKGLLNGSYGLVLLSVFPLGTLLVAKILESMFWSPYGGPTTSDSQRRFYRIPKDACSQASFGFELSAPNNLVLSNVSQTPLIKISQTPQSTIDVSNICSVSDR